MCTYIYVYIYVHRPLLMCTRAAAHLSRWLGGPQGPGPSGPREAHKGFAYKGPLRLQGGPNLPGL